MPPTSHEKAISTAIAVLRMLWDKTSPDKGIGKAQLLDACADQGIILDPRMLFSIVDGARAAGVPVDRPRTRGLSEEGYRFTERPFSAWEVAFLSDSVECSKALTVSEKAELRERLAGLLPDFERTSARRKIVSGPSSDLYRTTLSESLDRLQAAINERRRVSFDYLEVDGRGGVEPRRTSSGVPVEPYELLYRDEAYYLLAGKAVGERVEPRVFRVDRMRDIEVLDALCRSSLHDLGIDPHEVASAAFNMFVTGRERDVTLSFAPEYAKVVAEKFGRHVIRSVDERSSVAEVRVWVSRPFFAWVFQFAGGVRIQEPEDVIEQYRDILSVTIEGLPAGSSE